MQFKVPQNVQREDTIIGPLTMKQLIIIGGGGGLAYAIYIILTKAGYFVEVWLPPVALIVIITVSFAFVKVHELTFYRFVLFFIEYTLLPKKRYFVLGAGDVRRSLLASEEIKKPKGPEITTEVTKEEKRKKLEELVKAVERSPKGS